MLPLRSLSAAWQAAIIARGVELSRLSQAGVERQNILIERVLAPAQGVGQVLISGEIEQPCRSIARRATALSEAGDPRAAAPVEVVAGFFRRHFIRRHFVRHDVQSVL